MQLKLRSNFAKFNMEIKPQLVEHFLRSYKMQNKSFDLRLMLKIV